MSLSRASDILFPVGRRMLSIPTIRNFLGLGALVSLGALVFHEDALLGKVESCGNDSTFRPCAKSANLVMLVSVGSFCAAFVSAKANLVIGIFWKSVFIKLSLSSECKRAGGADLAR